MVGFTYFQILASDTTQHISKIDKENISTDYYTISEKNKFIWTFLDAYRISQLISTLKLSQEYIKRKRKKICSNFCSRKVFLCLKGKGM